MPSLTPTQLKPLHEVMLPLWEKCEELRPKRLSCINTYWYLGATYDIDNNTAELICEAWMGRWLEVEADLVLKTGRGGYLKHPKDWFFVVFDLPDLSHRGYAPTKYQALALACHAVLDEREQP